MSFRVEVPEIALFQRLGVFQRSFRDLAFFSADSENMKSCADQLCFRSDQLWFSLNHGCSELKNSALFQRESALNQCCSAVISLALKRWIFSFSALYLYVYYLPSWEKIDSLQDSGKIPCKILQDNALFLQVACKKHIILARDLQRNLSLFQETNSSCKNLGRNILFVDPKYAPRSFLRVFQRTFQNVATEVLSCLYCKWYSKTNISIVKNMSRSNKRSSQKY